MSFAIDKDSVRQALSVHAAIGLIASALLYLVCLTGALIVLSEEWQRAEQPHVPEMTSITPEAVQSAINHVLDSEKSNKPTTHLYVHLPTQGLPRSTITTDYQAVHLDTMGTAIVREQNSWTEFLQGLHYELHLPSILGLAVVGIAGVMMVALSISGIIAHPRIFRDAFRLRAKDRGGVGLADWHNRIGVWSLPFALAIALTGAMIGLASLTAYGLAANVYKGDIEAVYAPIFGAEGKMDARPAPTADVATALRKMQVLYPDAKPYYVVLHDPRTAGQHIQIIADHPRRLIFGEYYGFDAQGEFLAKTGLSDGAIGQQVSASAYKLHFGNYAGLPVKIAYLIFGIALCVMIAIGTFLWLGKRERRGLHHPRLRKSWEAVVWGVPLTLMMTLACRLFLGNDAPLVAIFWGLLGLVLLLPLTVRPQWNLKMALQALLCLTLLTCLVTMTIPFQ